MITNLDQALEQNKRLVKETFRVTQEHESVTVHVIFTSRKTKAELIVLKDKMNTLPHTGNPFYRNVSDREELVAKLTSAEAALQVSEEANLKLARSRKELDKLVHEMNKILKEANIKILSCQGQLRVKEEENADLKMKLALYDNKEGVKQKIDELSAQILEKETLLAVAWEEVKGKDSILENSIKTLQKMMEERCFIFEQSQKLKAQLDNNESNLKFIISQKDQEFQQIKVENNRLAEIIFKHEGFKSHYEEKIRNLEMQLENFKACPPQPLMQPPADFMTHMMENMNKMQLEIQRLNLQNFQQPRK